MAAEVHAHDRGEEPEGITLTAGGSSLTLVPALGGKLTSLRLAGRQWLWTSDVLPHQVPGAAERADDASYVRVADTGGYDECFPTVAPCTLPEDVPAFGGLRLPDHGELWSQEPAVHADHRAQGGGAVTVTWTGRRMPYRFRRTVRLEEEDVVEMRYEVTSEGDARIPFLWSAHPLLALTDATRLLLPEGARVRVDAAHGIANGGASGDGRWPMLDVDGSATSFARPAAVRDAYACKLFLDLPRGAVVATVEEEDARLSLHLDGGELPFLGIWINRGGWSGVPGAAPYRNLAFEPCTGAPDSLREALGAWRAASWLEPAETRRWTVVWRGSRR